MTLSPRFKKKKTLSPRFKEKKTLSARFKEETILSPRFKEKKTLLPLLSQSTKIGRGRLLGCFWRRHYLLQPLSVHSLLDAPSCDLCIKHREISNLKKNLYGLITFIFFASVKLLKGLAKVHNFIFLNLCQGCNALYIYVAVWLRHIVC